jgi:hypothetical protein
VVVVVEGLVDAITFIIVTIIIGTDLGTVTEREKRL